MKNKCILSFFLLSAVAFSGFAQIRHVKGIQSIDVMAGISGYGQVYQLGYVKYFSSKFYGKLNAFYEMGEYADIGYTSMGIDIVPTYTFLKAGEGIYINGLTGLTFSLDQLTQGAEEINVKNTFKYGAMVGAEVEFFITDKIVFLLNGNQRFLLQQNFGNTRFFASAGFRFNL